MRRDFTIGLVVPFAADAVPDEGLQMYPDVRFIPRGVGVRSLTPTGYDSACEAILPAAESLAAQGVDAIMVIGTSLTFYRGSDFHDRLMERLRAATGLPVSTMSQAVVDGLRSFGARRIVVATAYADDVNERLEAFLTAQGFEVLALEGFGLFGFGEPGSKSEADIIALGSKVCAQGPGAQGLADLVRRPADAGRGRAARGASRHSGRREHPGGVLGGVAARRCGQPRRRSRAAPGAINSRPCALRRFALNSPWHAPGSESGLIVRLPLAVRAIGAISR